MSFPAGTNFKKPKGNPVAARMAGAIRIVAFGRGTVTKDDLPSFGYTPAQVELYGDEAVAIFAKSHGNGRVAS